MASTYSNLKIQLMATGENSGTWGNVTNVNLGTALEQAIVENADIDFTSGDVTLTLTDTNAAQNARALRLTTTNMGAAQDLTVPAIEKPYIINNTGSSYAVTVKVSGPTGVEVPAGKTMWVYNNGTDVTDPVNHLTNLNVNTTFSLGGTNVTASAAELNLVDGASAGTVVNSAAVIYGANGELNAGVLQITGTNVTATAAELNYNDITTAGTTEASKSWVNDASGDISHGGALVTTDKLKVQRVIEKATVSATAATGTITYDVLTQQVLYYTSNATGNWTLNVRGDGSNSLDSLMATGESLSIAFITTQGGTAYYNSAFQIDGNGVTPEWQGGSAPTEGNASSLDVYTYTIIKTGSATFTVLAAVNQFA